MSCPGLNMSCLWLNNVMSRVKYMYMYVMSRVKYVMSRVTYILSKSITSYNIICQLCHIQAQILYILPGSLKYIMVEIKYVKSQLNCMPRVKYIMFRVKYITFKANCFPCISISEAMSLMTDSLFKEILVHCLSGWLFLSMSVMSCKLFFF